MRWSSRWLAPVALVAAAVAAPPALAQDGGFPVVVFEGRGLGHGVGLPLDGANHMARQGAGADEILDRFYPGTSGGSSSGLVRVLVGTDEDPAGGIDVEFPDGGSVRDGRVTPVAPSLPVRVPPGGTARVTYADDFYRVEVLDGSSVSGTREITPTSAPPPDAEGTTSTTPGLGASQQTLWLEPIEGGSIAVGGQGVGAELVEVVVEAQRMHLVAELDLEAYVGSLAFTTEDDPPLEPDALEAVVIAARSYAARASQADLEVGRFHVFGDERAFRFVGAGARDEVRAAATATAGRVRTHRGRPIAALVTAGAAGHTAAVNEVMTVEADAYPYLTGVEYEGALEYAWRVDMRLADAARALGYEGDPEGIEISSTRAGGRPGGLRVTGTSGALDVVGPAAHQALRLPSSRFEVSTETRTEPLAERTAATPFQELPNEPVSAGEGEPGAQQGDGGGADVPVIVALVAVGTLLAALLILLAANVKRRVQALRARREARRRHPTGDQPPPSAEPADTPTPPRVPPIPEPEPEPEPEPAPEPEPERPRREVTGPVWHNEPEWLDELLGGGEGGEREGDPDQRPD